MDERVHAARVVLKEVRAVSRLFRDLSPAFDARSWDHRLRGALKALAPARDEVVMRNVLDRYARTLPEADRGALAQALPRPRNPRPATLRRIGPLLDTFGRALTPVAEAGGWEPLDQAFATSRRRVRRLQKAAGGDDTPALWHRWRRRVKALAYQAQWVRPPGQPEWASLHHDAWRLQAHLGELQDLHITLDHLATLDLPSRVEKILRRLLRRAADTVRRRTWRARLKKKALRG
jgi:CHAD domain-containing protein